MDIDTINSFTWGAAMLATLMDSLAMFKIKNDATMINGFSYSLFVSNCDVRIRF